MLAKQMRVENSKTGRLPKEVCSGTLFLESNRVQDSPVLVSR